MSFEEEREAAKVAAQEAGEVIQEYRTSKGIRFKDVDGSASYLTDADVAAQRAIVDSLSEQFPGDGFRGEEESLQPNGEDRVWVIDPIDGTANYVHGFPAYCTSIALRENGEYVVGVIYNPYRDELFAAASGSGAFLNGSPIQVSDTENMEEALITVNLWSTASFLERLGFGFPGESEVYSVRDMGAAALDGAYVAAGRADAYVDLGINEWDVAAVAAIVEEAGGMVTLKEVDGSYLCIAANPHLHDRLKELVGEHQ